MIDLAKYANKTYDDDSYNCLHFAVELYQDLTDADLALFVGSAMTGRNHRSIDPAKFKQLIAIDTPVSPCLAIMHGTGAHAGIYYKHQIIHFNESGINCQPPHIAAIKHGHIKYYAV